MGEIHRAKVAELLAQMHAARYSVGQRIEDALVEHQRACSSRVEEAAAAWRSEQEVLSHRLCACESQLSSLREKGSEAEQHVHHLARLGRAAAAWKHEALIRGLQQKARRKRAAALRKLAREGEAVENEVTRRREALNKELRSIELADTKLREDRSDEIQALKDELEQWEDRAEAAEENLRQRDILADIAPIAEGDRIRRWAEAASGVGSVNFRGAANRLRNRTLMSSLEGEESNARASGSRKLPSAASAPSLPRLRGGLQQLEDQMQRLRPV